MRRAGKILANSHIEVIVDDEKYWQGDDRLYQRGKHYRRL